MSSTSQNIEYQLRVLDTKSTSFCGAKWYNATIFLGAGKTMSCHHNPWHDVAYTDVEENYKALHNTDIKKQQRQQMLDGIRPKGCSYCWDLEDAGSISDRVYKSQLHSERDLDRAFKSDSNQDFDLQVLELHFDKVCQMACSYCHAGYSTTWAQDIRENGPYEDVETDKRLHYKHERRIEQLFKPDQENPFVEAFYKWWDKDLHKTLKELRILGGEPLLSPHIWKFIEWFKKKDTECSLEFITNLGPRVDVDRFLTAIEGEQVVVMTSMETVGEHAEYIRDGVDYELWCRNVEKCLLSKNVKNLVILLTVNALSLFKITELLEQVENWKATYGKERVVISANILRYPVFQSMLVLPKKIREKYANILSTWCEWHNLAFSETEHEQLSRIVNYCNVVDEPDNIEQVRKDFASFFKQYDLRRDKNFLETFPELRDYYWYTDTDL
jgi:organic radical activating enzyme